MHPVALLLAPLLWMLPASARAQPTDMADRVAACAACHGERGQGLRGAEYVPHLAGKPAGYLRDQLQAFRDGRRHFGQMVWLVRNMDDAWMARIADWYAGMPPLTTPVDAAARPMDAALTARAEALVREGDALLGVPACSACHGDDLAGLEPGIPALVGLPADYVIAQLGAWRTRTRQSRAPDCMHDIASALDPRDLRALGEWLSRQGHADERRPAPAGSFLPPRSCGDLPSSERTRGAPTVADALVRTR